MDKKKLQGKKTPEEIKSRIEIGRSGEKVRKGVKPGEGDLRKTKGGTKRDGNNRGGKTREKKSERALRRGEESLKTQSVAEKGEKRRPVTRNILDS